MKKGVIIILLLGILLVSPLVLAQEQVQTYSGFNRFVDNVKMFFSSEDNKVMLALEIREKELNSAIINTQNGNEEEAEKNLERARKRLRYIQKQVSLEIVEDVKINIDETIDKINAEENLPNSFDAYILEEEKTRLTAELVIEVEGKEGRTLTRKIVEDSESGEDKVEITVGEDGSGQNKVVVEGQLQEQIQEQNRTREIETRINEIDDAIADVVESRIDIDVDKIDPDATPKSPAGDVDDDVLPGPQGIIGLFVPEPRDDGPPPDSETPGGSEDSGITGEVISPKNEESFLMKIFKKIF